MNSLSWFTTKILDSAESSIKTWVNNNIAPLSVESDLGEEATSLGITTELIEFVENICNHPNTFKDFPTDQLAAHNIILPLTLTSSLSPHSLTHLTLTHSFSLTPLTAYQGC
jgi:hypothetical protein